MIEKESEEEPGPTRVTLPGVAVSIEVPILLSTPEQKYEGTWEPGINQPTYTGPGGEELYLPLPEAQIKR